MAVRRRLYHPQLAGCAVGETLRLEEEEAHYALRVLRLEAADAIELFDGEGCCGSAEIEITGKRHIEVRLRDRQLLPAPSFQVDLAVALPKGPRAQDMIDSLSQIGVSRLILLNTDRSTVEPREAKLDRFVQGTIESARQCGRVWRMKIDPPRSFEDVVHQETHGLRRIAHPGEDSGEQGKISASSVLILIGPEGGWTDEELDLAGRQGYQRWSFGPHVMRIETAAVAAAAIASNRKRH